MDRKQSARNLRLKGYSYNEIQKELGIAKSTLSNWFADLKLPENAKKRLAKRVRQGVLNGLVERNKKQTILAQKRAKSTRAKAGSEIKKLSKHELKLFGIALYWAEGYKRTVVRGGKERTYHPISFTNSDPEMIRFFVYFLKEVMHIPREDMRVSLRLFQHQDQKTIVKFWCEVTKIPKKNFMKPFIIKQSTSKKRPANQLPYGVVQVRVSSTQDFHTLMGWIEGVKEKLPG